MHSYLEPRNDLLYGLAEGILGAITNEGGYTSSFESLGYHELQGYTDGYPNDDLMQHLSSGHAYLDSVQAGLQPIGTDVVEFTLDVLEAAGLILLELDHRNFLARNSILGDIRYTYEE